MFSIFVFDILGLEAEEKGNNDELTSKLIEAMIQLRQEAKMNKNFATADKIRNELNAMGIELRDTKDGAEWKLK